MDAALLEIWLRGKAIDAELAGMKSYNQNNPDFYSDEDFQQKSSELKKLAERAAEYTK